MASRLLRKVFGNGFDLSTQGDSSASLLSRRSSISLVQDEGSEEVDQNQGKASEENEQNDEEASEENEQNGDKVSEEDHQEEDEGPEDFDESEDAAPVEDKLSKKPAELSERCVRLCPHETLSFARFQKVTNLPGFVCTPFSSYLDRKSIDAFTNTALPHHAQMDNHRIHTPDVDRGHFSRECPRLCKPNPTGSNVIVGSSNYGSGPPRRTGPYVELEIQWEIDLRKNPQRLHASQPEMKRFLDTFGIWLCPHIGLGHEQVVKKLHFLINEPDVDPVDTYTMKEDVKELHRCYRCKTNIEVRNKLYETRVVIVMAQRFLGKGKSAKDKSWLVHCEN